MPKRNARISVPLTPCVQFTDDLVLEAVLAAVSVIDESREYPKKLPRSMSARVGAAADIAGSIKVRTVTQSDWSSWHSVCKSPGGQRRRPVALHCERGESVLTRAQSLGYKDDLGYHQLLYPNEADTRKVLSWLVNQLPQTEALVEGQGARCRRGLRPWRR